MSTNTGQPESDETQNTDAFDVIEVPPARSQSTEGKPEEPDTSDGVEEEVLEDDPSEVSEDETTGEADVEEESEEAADSDDPADQVDDAPQDGPPSRFKCVVMGGTLKTVVSTIGAIVDESRIHVDEDGLRMRAVDSANVAMDDLEVDAAAFESYDATPGVIAVDLDRFYDIVKLAKADDLAQVFLDHETRKLVIHIDGLEFTMACLVPETLRTVPDVPDLDLPAVVTVSRAALDRGVKAADMVADHVTVRVDGPGERFLIESEGDTDEVSYEVPEDYLEFESSDDAESVFSLDYMKKLVKSTPAGADVTLRHGRSSRWSWRTTSPTDTGGSPGCWPRGSSEVMIDVTSFEPSSKARLIPVGARSWKALASGVPKIYFRTIGHIFLQNLD